MKKKNWRIRKERKYQSRINIDAIWLTENINILRLDGYIVTLTVVVVVVTLNSWDSSSSSMGRYINNYRGMLGVWFDYIGTAGVN